MPSTSIVPSTPEQLALLTTGGWEDYELLDSGDGRKLERYGEHLLDRPEPNALWQRRSLASAWDAADARFDTDAEGGAGRWIFRRQLPHKWAMRYSPLDLSFYVSCTPFRHTGVFPEQAAHWLWLDALVRRRSAPRVLVLFGYTGIATCVLAAAGAHVTHVDASRPAVTWANENAAASGVADRPIRWLIDDVMRFLQREARRGSRYDGIVMDPPAFGRGPKGEVWRFASSMPRLFDAVRAVTDDETLFLLVNAYAVPASATMLSNLLTDVAPSAGTIEAGELALDGGGRVLSTGIFARWAAS